MIPYLEKAREDVRKRNHPILYSWTVGRETWLRAVGPVVREQTRMELRSVFLLLAFLAFSVGLSFLIGREGIGLLISVILIVYGLITWIFYLRCHTGILFPPERTFFLTQYGFFNGYEYVARVRSYDIELREKRIFIQGSIFIKTNSRTGNGYWKEKEMLLMWDRDGDGAEIMKSMKQLILRKTE